MDNTGSDKFALEAFNLAFSIQRILQSRLIPPEAKETLVQNYSKLREQVGLLTKIRENKETDQKRTNQKQPNGGLYHDNSRH
jgi:hypothetical protein